MIVKDPSFAETPLTGTYLWESSYEGIPDPQDGKVKLGVQLTRIEDVLKNYHNANFFVRKFNDYSAFTDEALKQVHEIAYLKPYDINPRDWIHALFQSDPTPQLMADFGECICWINFNKNRYSCFRDRSDNYAPCDFALVGENLHYRRDYQT